MITIPISVEKSAHCCLCSRGSHHTYNDNYTPDLIHQCQWDHHAQSDFSGPDLTDKISGPIRFCLYVTYHTGDVHFSMHGKSAQSKGYTQSWKRLKSICNSFACSRKSAIDAAFSIIIKVMSRVWPQQVLFQGEGLNGPFRMINDVRDITQLTWSG